MTTRTRTKAKPKVYLDVRRPLLEVSRLRTFTQLSRDRRRAIVNDLARRLRRLSADSPDLRDLPVASLMRRYAAAGPDSGGSREDRGTVLIPQRLEVRTQQSCAWDRIEYTTCDIGGQRVECVCDVYLCDDGHEIWACTPR